MITETEIETYACQIAEPDFEVSKANLDALIGHLGASEFRAVLRRAAEISRQRGRAAHAVADSLENLDRLGKAAGCPDGEPVIPWLQARGLVEEVNGGFRFKTAKPGAVT